MENKSKQKIAVQAIGIACGGLVVASLAHAETVYQVTQPNGKISLTDSIDTAYQLSGGHMQNIKALDNLNTSAPNQNTATLSSQALPIQNSPSPVTESPQPLKTNATTISQKGRYRLQLITPEPNMVYHRPAQSINIAVSVTPKLQQGDSVSYWIDGKKIAQTQDLTLEISSLEIPLDKHTLEVEVLNILNQPIATAQADFYVVQNSIAIQKRRKLEKLKAQLEAYDELPWYQKLAVRLGIQKK